MKLHAQYSRVTIISSITILLIAALGYYFILRYVLNEQLDEALRVEEVEILDHVNKENSLPEATTYKDQRIRFEKSNAPVKRHFSTSKIDDGEEAEWSRQLVFPIKIGQQDYTASVSKSQEENEKLIALMLTVPLGLILLLGIVLFFLNRILLKRLWRPFYFILSEIKRFNVRSPSAVKFENTPIDEFRELGSNLTMMTEKVTNDYLSLKSFADHASHEMQTPLAVINSRLDILIQDPGLSEGSLKQVQGIYDSIGKMSRLSHSLLLLTKIENSQFSGTEEFNLKSIVEDKLRELDELIHINSFQVHKILTDVNIRMNKELADILVSNLLTNAIKHTKGNNKSISIVLNGRLLELSNPGKQGLDPRVIFDKFSKSEYSDGTGLGLAIAKQICELYHFNIQYEFSSNEHHFKVLFNQ